MSLRHSVYAVPAMLGALLWLSPWIMAVQAGQDLPQPPAMPLTSTVLVQGAAHGTGATPQPDYVLNECQDTESTGEPTSAMRGVDPAYMLKNHLQNQVRQYIDIAAIRNVTLLEGTEHGKIVGGTDNLGLTSYRYDPPPGYVGTDKAVFMVEHEGKRYKIVVELNVSLMVDEKVPSTCPPPRLIKVGDKPKKG